MTMLKWGLLLLLALAGPAAANTDEAWQALREGRAMLLMRHTHAPGTGDPPGFVLEQCHTQRNLDELGREQARAWGDRLREQGIHQARVYSSQYCRAQETATLLGLGEVVPEPTLSSFFARRERRAEQTRELRRFVAGLEPGLPVVLVSHQVNLTALTGLFPRAGEALILALPLEDRVRVLARINP
ncbi:histidine phosphatase family protein [Zobellella taiwanensis]|jgi:phosphohistidine phosphatase SixA|nr:histidine phosphatase family protein [Zobellella taiwanensis]